MTCVFRYEMLAQTVGRDPSQTRDLLYEGSRSFFKFFFVGYSRTLSVCRLKQYRMVG
jgi:hypothetical protein